MRNYTILAISLYVIAISIYFTEKNDIKKCDFVCSHLCKEIQLNDGLYTDCYLNATLRNGKVEYPYFVSLDGTPIVCQCSFKFQNLENITKDYEIYDLKKIVYLINYTEWKNWWKMNNLKDKYKYKYEKTQALGRII